MMAALELSGVEVYHVHSVTEGQFEIALAPLEPHKAIDALMQTQETIRTIYARHGLKATTAPLPTFAGPTNGVHVHLTAKPALPREAEESFIAGILRSLPRLCLLGLANYDSYHRVVGGSAGEWLGWGRWTRQFPIRQVDENRWEFRFLDATANVYLFLAALLQAGRAGIDGKVPLEMIGAEPSPARPLYPTEPEYVEHFGIDTRMPKSLESALEGDSWGEVGELTNVGIGPNYCKVKEDEIKYFSAMTDEERRRRFVSHF
jgi:glutamine synthetase